MNATLTNPVTDAITPPSIPGEWSLNQIIQALSRPLPQSLLATRRQGGKDLTCIAWHTANRLLDKYAPGWAWEINKLELSDTRIFLVGSLSIPTSDGLIIRSATGTESLVKSGVEKHPNALVALDDLVGETLSLVKQAMG